MVECEYKSQKFWKENGFGFNRYMVECELLMPESIVPTLTVLIDTWWNVNINNYDSHKMSKMVLIDTWWNVNLLLSNTNKTIVKVLIDTWWNVN